MSPHQTVLQLDHATKAYGTGPGAVRILDDVSFELAPGEMLGVMGPSGSGKTTTLTVSSGLQRPSSGRVTLLGQEIQDLSQRELAAIRREKLGFVFQSFNLFDALTAQENVEFALDIVGRSGANARLRAATLLQMVGLGHRAGTKPMDLSGGEQQHVCIARAIANHPQVIFADEPTASLDAVRAFEMMALLRAVARDLGAAMLVVTHDLRVHHICDRLLWLESGRLRAIAPDEIAGVAIEGRPAP